MWQHKNVLHFNGEPVLPLLIKASHHNFRCIFNEFTGTNSFLPYRYGLAGILSTNVMIVGLLYLGYLGTVAYCVLQKIKADRDSSKVQSRIVSFNCAYIAVSGISFFMNVRF